MERIKDRVKKDEMAIIIKKASMLLLRGIGYAIVGILFVPGGMILAGGFTAFMLWFMTAGIMPLIVFIKWIPNVHDYLTIGFGVINIGSWILMVGHYLVTEGL
jgi:hypothetical protein